MKVIVLGSGVIGVTTAWYLAKSGHEVVVLDRQSGPALETSYANAGQVSPGYSSPWAAPGLPLKAVKWLLQKHSPLFVRPVVDPRLYAWVIELLRNCTAERYILNKSRMLPIASYSRDSLKALREEVGITYDGRSRGTLQLFRTEKQLEGMRRDVRVLNDCEVPYEVLDVDGCVKAEPALDRVREKIVGGLRLPGDETGDCYKFTSTLAQLAAERGVTFRYGVRIDGLESDGRRVTGVRTDQAVVSGDAYVAALGSYTPRVLRPLGLRLPVYPVKGYSMTVPVTDGDMAPVSTLMDETYKVAITRLGDRIRAAGTAELCGYDLALRPSRYETVRFVVGDLFGAGGDLSKAQFWTGLRPMTPDGPPIIGPTRYQNLFLNTGQGTLGWTMSCGSGRVVADLVSGRQPDVDIQGLTLERYGKR